MLSIVIEPILACLISFLTSLHSWSYQGLVLLLLILVETSIENLLMDDERVVEKLWYRFSIFSMLDKGTSSFFRSWRKISAYFYRISGAFGNDSFPPWDRYTWQYWVIIKGLWSESSSWSLNMFKSINLLYIGISNIT